MSMRVREEIGVNMVGLRREYAGRGPLVSSSSHYIVPPWLAGLGCCSPTTTLVPALSPPGSTPDLSPSPFVSPIPCQSLGLVTLLPVSSIHWTEDW